MRSLLAVGVIIMACACAAAVMMWPGERLSGASETNVATEDREAPTSPLTTGPDDRRLVAIERDVRRLRAELRQRDAQASRQTSTDGWNTSGSIHFVEDEQGFRSVYYVAREGQSLPSLDEE